MRSPSATVFIVVDREYGPRLAELPRGEPIWIVDTPINRAIANELWMDSHGQANPSDVTLFKSTAASAVDCVINQLETIDLHHGVYSADPAYSALQIIGIEPTDRLKAELALFGLTEITITESGFRAGRPL